MRLDRRYRSEPEPNSPANGNNAAVKLGEWERHEMAGPSAIHPVDD